VIQGQVGDCQTLAVLVGVAKRDPALLQRSIVDMGNGIYAVDFKPFGTDQYVMVDATLPVTGGGAPYYAQLGHQNSLWVALMEKAFTFVRAEAWNNPGIVGTYSVESGGGSGDMMKALGANTVGNVGYNASTPNALWLDAVIEANAGQIVTVSTFGPTGSTLNGGLVGAHMYYVDTLNYGWVNGTYTVISMTLRNPWGGSNEFITVNEQSFNQDISSATWASL
jgi:hypothetical protein